MGGYHQLPVAPYQSQETDPISAFTKIMQLKAMGQEQQLRSQQLANEQLSNQSGQVELQQRQQQFKDQQAMTSAMKEWDGKDFSALPSLVLKHGASAQAVMSLKTGIIKQQQDLANLSKDQLANEKTKNDYFAQLIDNVKSLPPEQQAQAFEQAKADAVQKGYADPQQIQGMQYQGPQQLDIIEKSLIGHNASIEQALKESQQKEADARAAEAQANTTKTNLETTALQQYGGMTQQVADAKYRALQMKVAGHVPLSPDDKAFVQAYEKQKTLVPTATFNLQNGGATSSNGQPSEMAKALASGEMKWNDVVSARTPMKVKEELLGQVKQINPQFNSGDFDVEKKVREKFTSGNVSDQLMAINTAREHMKTFSSLADALENGDTQAANKIGNAFGVQFGSDKATNFRIASQAFGGEVGKAFDGAGVTQGERAEAQHNFSENMSPAQFRGAIKTVDELLAGKQKSAQQSYDSGTSGKPNFGSQGGGGKEIHYKVVNGQLVQQ